MGKYSDLINEGGVSNHASSKEDALFGDNRELISMALNSNIQKFASQVRGPSEGEVVDSIGDALPRKGNSESFVELFTGKVTGSRTIKRGLLDPIHGFNPANFDTSILDEEDTISLDFKDLKGQTNRELQIVTRFIENNEDHLNTLCLIVRIMDLINTKGTAVLSIINGASAPYFLDVVSIDHPILCGLLDEEDRKNIPSFTVRHAKIKELNAQREARGVLRRFGRYSVNSSAQARLLNKKTG